MKHVARIQYRFDKITLVLWGGVLSRKNVEHYLRKYTLILWCVQG